MNNCYKYEKIIYNDGILSDAVDATYIIHLEGNGRLPHIKKQLEEYHPTNIVYIVFNKGYKKCAKQEYIKNTARDLVDANFQIFKHSEEKGYNNILVLEDDFIFSPKIKEKEHRENVLRFLKENQNKPYIYLLGCIPTISVPYDYYNYWGILCGTTHSTIYNKKIRFYLLRLEQQSIDDIDRYLLSNYYHYKYLYYTPLCYQLFPETENSKSWGGESIIFKNICRFMPFIAKILNMDKTPEPGFSYLYIFSKIIFFLLLLVFVIFLFFISKKITHYYKRNGKIFNFKY
jgi:hypothetical protein